MICCLRARTRKALKGNCKSQTTTELIGCNFNFFTKWIEFQLPVGYSISDIGKTLHIDHVNPLSSFNLLDEKELQTACGWLNLQPLEASKNLSKSNKINNWLLVMQEVKAHYFLKTLG